MMLLPLSPAIDNNNQMGETHDPIHSRLDTTSAEFAANREAMQALVEPISTPASPR